MYRTIDEIHRERLKMLIEQYGSQVKLAKAIGRHKALVSQWLVGAKRADTGKVRKMGTETARDIEEKLGLPYGWFDQPIQPAQNNKAEQMQVSNNYGSGSQHATFYNLYSGRTRTIPAESLSTEQEKYLETMPLLDIDSGVDFALDSEEYLKKINDNGNLVSIFIPHSSHTFGIQLPDDIPEEVAGEHIKKGSIVVIEPKIEPRHGDIVLVGLNYYSGNRRGMIAKCSFGLDNVIRIRYNEMPAAELPEGAWISGVVVEIKRRINPTDTIQVRLNKDWDILNTLSGAKKPERN